MQQGCTSDPAGRRCGAATVITHEELAGFAARSRIGAKTEFFLEAFLGAFRSIAFTLQTVCRTDRHVDQRAAF
jgi:hypothetical protein